MCLLDRSLTGSDPMVVVVASSVSLLSLLLIGLAVLVARGRNGVLPLPILDVGLASDKEGVGHDRRGQHVVGRALVNVAVGVVVLVWKVVLVVSVMNYVIRSRKVVERAIATDKSIT